MFDIEFTTLIGNNKVIVYADIDADGELYEYHVRLVHTDGKQTDLPRLDLAELWGIDDGMNVTLLSDIVEQEIRNKVPAP